MKCSLITLRDLSFGYRRNATPVLRDLSLGFDEGKVSAILGPNGVGKTTLLYIMLGWLSPTGGSVLLNHRPLSSYTQRERGKWMSLVPQREHIPFEYSMLEYVLLGRAPYLKPLESPDGEDIRIGADALVSVGLDPGDRRPITRFSGGERQLLKIARALTQQPRIILLDEPASHLDLRNKKMLVDIMRKQAAEGVTLLFTTHDPEMASACAGNVVLIRNGTVLRSGSAHEMLEQGLLSETYDADITVSEIQGKRVTLWF